MFHYDHDMTGGCDVYHIVADHADDGGLDIMYIYVGYFTNENAAYDYGMSY